MKNFFVVKSLSCFPCVCFLERLAEARKTEVENNISLQKLLKIEEEKKPKKKKEKSLEGPYIRYFFNILTHTFQTDIFFFKRNCKS